jgi:hypothetical protein
MNDMPSGNRFTDHEESKHYIAGSRGGLEGDPLEMTRFCLTVHPIWGRVLGRHLASLGAAYADDAYFLGRIEPTLMSLADTVRSFRQDADLEVCLARCTCQAFRRNVLASVILSRNVTPDNMATSCKDPAHIGPAHVDQKIVNEVLSAATGDTARNLQQTMLNWCKLKVQSPHHKGGFAITTTAACSILFGHQQVRHASCTPPSQ